MTVQTPRIAIRDTTLDGLLDKPAKANEVRYGADPGQADTQPSLGEDTFRNNTVQILLISPPPVFAVFSMFFSPPSDRVHAADQGGRREDEGPPFHLRRWGRREAVRLQVRLPEAHGRPAGKETLTAFHGSSTPSMEARDIPWKLAVFHGSSRRHKTTPLPAIHGLCGRGEYFSCGVRVPSP